MKTRMTRFTAFAAGHVIASAIVSLMALSYGAATGINDPDWPFAIGVWELVTAPLGMLGALVLAIVPPRHTVQPKYFLWLLLGTSAVPGLVMLLGRGTLSFRGVYAAGAAVVFAIGAWLSRPRSVPSNST